VRRDYGFTETLQRRLRRSLLLNTRRPLPTAPRSVVARYFIVSRRASKP
jgi:hypothetical protein